MKLLLLLALSFALANGQYHSRRLQHRHHNHYRQPASNNRYNGNNRPRPPGINQAPNNPFVVDQWNQLEYGFPSMQARNDTEAAGNLIISNGIPIDVQPHYGNQGRRIFITIPKFDVGVPYSLATVSAERQGNGPVIQPYPHYAANNLNGVDCTGITSAFRVAINECNQMWVIDSGVIGTDQICPPQLLLFDLNTDQIIHRYRFNETHYTPSASLLITPVINTRDPPPRGRCQNTMVYIADVTFHGLVIYDQQRQQAWRAENKFMYPYPEYGTHTIAGESFDLMDGMFALATDKRNLYFHPLASIGEFAVALNALDNSTNWDDGPEAMPEHFRQLGVRSSQCAQQTIDSRGNLYCVTFNPVRLISWNVNTPYRGKNLREINFDASLLEFVSGMKVVVNPSGGEELWMLSNRFQKIATGSQNENEVNYRILKLNLDSAQNSLDYPNLNKDLHNKLIFNN